MAGFSGTVKLAGLDDFITPSQACVKPQLVEKKKRDAKTARILIGTEDDTGDLPVEPEPLKKVEITLNDCLACSGCVTSAETILITKQSKEELYSACADASKFVIVSLSPQARASMAAQFGLSILETHQKLVSLFQSIGVKTVFDTSFSRDISLAALCEEFVSISQSNEKKRLPLLVSACPGWVCYAEKTEGAEILAHMSKVKSPQQVMGAVVKNYFCDQQGLSPRDVFHCTIMPCYDKKLEASRDDFFNEALQTPEVDCVLTPLEIMDLINEKNIDFRSLPQPDIPTMFTNYDAAAGQFFGAEGGSGGYLATVFKHAARVLHGVEVHSVTLHTGRNRDLKETFLEVGGKKVLRFAAAYGFRNIQNIIRKHKRKQLEYDFVEVMACPSGCVNGGGQLRAAPPQTGLQLVAEVDRLYHAHMRPASPTDNQHAMALVEGWLGGLASAKARALLHTQFHEREKFAPTAVAMQW